MEKMNHYYTKLFGKILDSTIWQEDNPTRIVWITMLAMSDKDGMVSGTVPGLARRAGVSLEECEVALKKFVSPDKYSNSQEFEGRRIERVDGGWRLLNHAKYRAMRHSEERREYKADKQREYRAKQKKTPEEVEIFTGGMLGKEMNTVELLEKVKAFHGGLDTEPSYEVPEEVIKRSKDEVQRKEKIQEEVRAKHNKKFHVEHGQESADEQMERKMT